MNPYSSNPYMMILKADPDKYINRTAPTILALIKIVEGCAAFLWCFRMFDCLIQIAAGRAVQSPAGVLLSLLPRAIARLLLPNTIPSGGTVWKILGCAAAACILIALLCLAAEAVAAILLRFAMPALGAGWFKYTRKWTLAVCVLFTVCVVISAALQAYSVFQAGLSMELAVLRPLIVQLILILLLAVRIAYHRGAVIIMEAIDYEFRLGFKETGMAEHKLGLCSFLLGLLCLAAAVQLYRLSMGSSAAIFAVLSVKYFAVWNSWQFFSQCHR